MTIKNLSSHPVTYVSVRDLASYWMVSRRQIYKYISSGELPAVRMSARCYRVSTRAAAEFERLRTRRGGEPALTQVPQPDSASFVPLQIRLARPQADPLLRGLRRR
jgi:excisionase family DNA binding protein